MSRFYDIIAGGFESKLSNLALEQLNLTGGEIVLEIGFGTGHCLVKIAEKIGLSGKAYGIDISSGMLDVTRERLQSTGLMESVELVMEMPPGCLSMMTNSMRFSPVSALNCLTHRKSLWFWGESAGF